MKPNMGQDGFVWFFGRVEDREDPEQLGRVRVRIFNFHSENKADVDTNMLPWAWLGQNPNSAASAGIGRSPTGIMVGSLCFGFFLDGKRAQMPVVVATFGGKPGGENDVHQLARGTNTVQKGDLPDEPKSPYKAKYPYNKVEVTESGHIIELDDTPGAERIHIYHNSGSYFEIHPNGDHVVKGVNNSYDLTKKDKTVYVGGDLKITVKGNADIEVTKAATINAKESITITSPDITIEES